MSTFNKFLEGFFEAMLFGDSPSENTVEEDSEPTLVHHMSEDGEVVLTLSGNAHSPIE